MMKRNAKYMIVACVVWCACMTGCDRSDKHVNDPSQPIIVNRFYPTTGGVGTEILITGRNFTQDADQVSVTLGGKSLMVIGCNMNNIMVVVPKKLGDGKLEIRIGDREPVTTLESFTYVFSAAVSTYAGTGDTGYADGPTDIAVFNFDDGGGRKGSLCVDDDLNVYVGDIMNFCVRKIDSQTGVVSTLAGKAGLSGMEDGLGSAARFQGLYGMDCDSEGNVYLTDVFGWTLRKITPDGNVTTLVETPFEPWYIAVDRRNDEIYVASESSSNGGVWKWGGEGTEFIKIYGGAMCSAVAVGPDGYVYVSNITTHRIVRLDPATWQSEEFAGSSQGFEDGPLLSAKFSYPIGLSFGPTGDLYVAGNGTWTGADNPDQSVRRIDIAGGRVVTIAGSGTAGYTDSNGATALFSGPQDLTVDKNGTIYVFDKLNNAIRRIDYE